eukprot:TRINITY_DN32424_c0_g1_i1.p1 TRINITY_DN32424_c0_g1~~TRINITY_DN32424_c0_g1_i1.p1  ORF type:complete len:312 (-),score=19.46 TRINITY_DN32424_c0_g1_i1:230-1030(-)
MANVLGQARSAWICPFEICDSEGFRSRRWACSVSAIKVSTSVSREASFGRDSAWIALDSALPACIAFAHQICHLLPVCWGREAMVSGVSTSSQDNVVTQTTFSSNLVSYGANTKSVPLFYENGNLYEMQSGLLLRRHGPLALQKLRHALPDGASVTSATTNSCFCATQRSPDSDDRDRKSWSQLHASETYTFALEGIPCHEGNAPEQRCPLVVKLSIDAFMVPFFGVSSDWALNFPGDQAESDFSDGLSDGIDIPPSTDAEDGVDA